MRIDSGVRDQFAVSDVENRAHSRVEAIHVRALVARRRGTDERGQRRIAVRGLVLAQEQRDVVADGLGEARGADADRRGAVLTDDVVERGAACGGGAR